MATPKRYLCLEIIFLILFCNLFLIIKCQRERIKKASSPRIAIIGAGIGGTSTGYFLRELFGSSAPIDIYESTQVGGRVKTANVAGYDYEAGASVIHTKNQYMVNFAKELDLSHRKTVSTLFGLYNGEDFVFKENEWSFVNYWNLLWRYGIGLMKLNSWINNILQKFMKIYDLQDKHYAYTTVEGLLDSLDPNFLNMTQISLATALKREGFADIIINELAVASIKTNYGQTPIVNSFTGAVSLSAMSDSLWCIDGGNNLVPEKLINYSDLNLINNTVTKVILMSKSYEKPLFKIESIPEQIDGNVLPKSVNQEYDFVVLATPMVKSLLNIRFVQFPQPIQELPGRYHRTVTTLVHGTLNRKGLSLTPQDANINAILVVNPDLFFNSISRVLPVNFDPENDSARPKPVWKIFSPKPLTEDELNGLFKMRLETLVVDWQAYPHYSPPEFISSFVLYDNLFYVNGIEWASSAMEMSAISARNVALLIYNYCNGGLERIDSVVISKRKTEL